MEHSKSAVSTHKQKQTQVALIGGIERLRNHYISEAEKQSINLRIFNTTESNISAKIQNFDAVVIFTNKISHCAKYQVMEISKIYNIPVVMSHSCGICSLRECMNCIKTSRAE